MIISTAGFWIMVVIASLFGFFMRGLMKEEDRNNDQVETEELLLDMVDHLIERGIYDELPPPIAKRLDHWLKREELSDE